MQLRLKKAICKAIKEQQKDLGVTMVFDGYLETKDNGRYSFDENVYSMHTVASLRKGTIDEIKLTLIKD